LSRLKQEVERKIKGENRYISKYPLTPLEVFEGNSLPNLQGGYKEIRNMKMLPSSALQSH